MREAPTARAVSFFAAKRQFVRGCSRQLESMEVIDAVNGTLN
jgi:hypothetical protein